MDLRHRRQEDTSSAALPRPALAFVATCDLVGLVRGRSVPAAVRDAVVREGLGWVPANLALTVESIVDENLFGSTGDLRLKPDPSSLTEIPPGAGHPGVSLLLADQVELTGDPWRCCPREFLKTAVRQLADRHGLVVDVAFEHEFMLRSLEPTAPFSFRRFRTAEPFGTLLVQALSEAGLDPETWLPEYGANQFEITVRPTEALQAADRAILLREVTRDLARRLDLPITFAPLPDRAGSGNGVHIHFSLRDCEGRPVLYDPTREGRLSELGARFCAGILEHAASVVALTASHPTSMARLLPHRWSVGRMSLDVQDREALLRICPTFGDDSEAGRRYNIEYRAADATANPWLALGALLHAGIDGLEQDLAPARIGVTSSPLPMPQSLEQALCALASDSVMCEALGADLAATYLSVKRTQIAQAAALDEEVVFDLAADVY